MPRTFGLNQVHASEVLGTYLQPTMAEVIRTGGNPRDQRCQLSSSEEVAIY